MENTKKGIIKNKHYFLIALVMLLLTHFIMGVLLLSMSKKALRQQIDQRMLDIANTAAYQLDGDEIEKFTADDVGSESYEKAKAILTNAIPKVVPIENIKIDALSPLAQEFKVHQASDRYYQ